MKDHGRILGTYDAYKGNYNISLQGFGEVENMLINADFAQRGQVYQQVVNNELLINGPMDSGGNPMVFDTSFISEELLNADLESSEEVAIAEVVGQFGGGSPSQPLEHVDYFYVDTFDGIVDPSGSLGYCRFSAWTDQDSDGINETKGWTLGPNMDSSQTCNENPTLSSVNYGNYNGSVINFAFTAQ